MNKKSAAVSQPRIKKDPKTKNYRLDKMSRQIPYFVMIAIPFVYFIVFKYWPMFGLTIAFQDYKLGAPFVSLQSKWVGLKWFKLLVNSPFFPRLVRNTVLLSLYSLFISFPMAIAMAIMLNEVRNKRLRKLTSNVSLLPHFISTAVIVGIMFNFFSVGDGLVNQILGELGMEKIDFMGSSSWFRTMYIGSGVWQNVGFSAVVFTAAISGIDPTLYEAAALDGSSRVKNIFYITIPCILPTIIIMLILRIGSIMSVGYEKIILMYTPGIYETADTLATYSYRAAFQDNKTSFASAIGMFNSVINLLLVVGANKLSKKVSETALW